MLKEGVFLGKRYEILGRVGSGGMADVYKGKDHKLNRYVAIKVLKSDYRTDEIFIQKFLSEAQAAAGLMHPNVVNVYDVGQDRGLYYMVMELVEGITLKDYIEKKGRLTAKETISISIQMVTGIQAAHNQHIIHRDIKPQNIIISKEGKVKVTDFGIARATTSTKTISASVMGSVHYTSPEQARGGIVDEKSDIYSAGITMYEMVTGHVPFDGDSTVSVAIKHLQEAIVSPAEEVPDIPYSLECIIMKCTQKNPEKRYPNCQALILDLKRCLVNPEGDFVNASRYGTDTDETVMMSTEEMELIKERGYRPDDDYDEYDDDDDYDDNDDDDYNDGRKKNSDVDPNTRKIMKILMVVAAIIIAFIVLFIAVKATGLFKNAPKAATQKETQVTVPNVLGMKKNDAKKALNDKKLGIKVADQKTSDKYAAGTVMRQDPGADTKVDKNTEIKVVISLGKAEKSIQVPDVVGQNESDAQKALEDMNLVVDFKYDYSSTTDEGKVISMNPDAGTTVKEGSTVTILISKGAEKVAVPPLVGLKSADADAALIAVGLVSGNVTEDYSNDYAAGVVMSQTTKDGSKVDKGSSVDYVVSKGAKVQMSSVPSLSGQTEDSARQLLIKAGLQAGNVSYDTSSTVTKGYVISQSAAAGSQMVKGSSVDFVISTGPPASQDPSQPTTPDNPSDGSQGTDDSGNSTEGQ